MEPDYDISKSIKALEQDKKVDIIYFCHNMIT